jgi:hypothetical protein
MGLQIQVLNASIGREIDAVFATIVRERLDAFFVSPNPFFNGRRVQIEAEQISRLAEMTKRKQAGIRRIGW